MQSKQKRLLVVPFLVTLQCLLLLGTPTFASSEKADNGEYLSVDFDSQRSDKVISGKIDQEDHNQLPSLPGDDLPSGETEGDEKNKEKDSNEDDGLNHRYLLKNSLALSNKTSTNCSASTKIGGVRIPLFVLFHCWKSFLA